MNKWIDLTIAIDKDFMVYPGDPKIEITEFRNLEKDGYNINILKTGMHVGTHLDYKSHMLSTDELSEDFDVNKLIGKAIVIKPRVLSNIISSDDIIDAYETSLIKPNILIINTGHAKKLNTKEYYNQPKFESKIIAFLKEKKIQVLAVDMPTVAYYDSDKMLQMHWDLLGNDISIVENLTNLDVLNEIVDFIALPIKVKNIDGALLRVIAKNS